MRSRERERDDDITRILVCEGRCNPQHGTPDSNYATLREYAQAIGARCEVRKAHTCMGGCGLGKRIDVEYANGDLVRYAQTGRRLPGQVYRKLPDPITGIVDRLKTGQAQAPGPEVSSTKR